jgi:methyl-accepting chemotaxis protein
MRGTDGDKGETSVRKSMTAKMVVAILLLIVLPLTAAGTWFSLELKSNFTDVEAERGMNDLQTTHEMFDFIAANLVSTVKNSAYWEEHRVAIEKRDESFIEDSVLSLLDVNQYLSGVYVTDLKGAVIGKREHAAQALAVDDQLPKIAEKIGKEKNLAGLVRTNQGLQMVGISKVTDEKGEAEPTGLLLFFRPVDAAFLGSIKSISKAEIVLYDGQTLISTYEGFDQGRAKELSVAAQGKSEPIVQSSSDAKGQVTESYDSLKDLYGTSIGFALAKTVSQTGAQVRQDLVQAGSIAGLLLLLSVGGLGFAFYRMMSKPLQQLSQEMARVADGDLTDGLQQKRLGERRSDEIGQIAQAFLTMRDGLKRLVYRVYEESNLLSDGSREFAASTEEARGTLGLIAASSSDIEGLVERTFDQVEQASVKLYTLEQQAQTISRHSGDSVEAAAQMEAAVYQGQGQVERSFAVIEEIQESAAQSEARVIALQQVADEIKGVVNLIKAVSGQTGMLALNASIEAARAGDHGRGFAIVAQEVGKLSEQARSATAEIEALLGRIHTSVVDVCETTERLKDRSQQGVTAVHATREVFAQILTHIGAVEGKIRDIRQEAAKQEGITQQGVQAVSAVKDMASEMVASVSGASAATEEAFSSMHAIAESSNQLAELAEELMEDVSKFQL